MRALALDPDAETLVALAQDPYPLLKQFQWHEFDVDDEAEVPPPTRPPARPRPPILLRAPAAHSPGAALPSQLSDVYTLLNENYVEDDDNMFRFDYSPQFLRWALKPPGWKKMWHLCVRVAATGKMVACITAVPVLLNIKGV